VLGALCQSFLDSLSANDKRYFVGKRHSAVHGRVTLGKKNRNTFLGKRFEEANYGADEEGVLPGGGAMDGLMTSSGASKRQRNNFLGKRVARSVDPVTSVHDEGRLSRLIKQFVDKLATELTQERGHGNGDDTAAVPDAMELLDRDWAAGAGGKERDWAAGAVGKDELARSQRAKNTFLG